MKGMKNVLKAPFFGPNILMWCTFFSRAKEKRPYMMQGHRNQAPRHFNQLILAQKLKR
jgi:hypothetical protein